MTEQTAQPITQQTDAPEGVAAAEDHLQSSATPEVESIQVEVPAQEQGSDKTDPAAEEQGQPADEAADDSAQTTDEADSEEIFVSALY